MDWPGGSLEQGIRYARQREQFGRWISKFQAVQFQIAQLATELEAARLLTYNAARLKDAKLSFVKEAAMAKYFASQVAEKIASQVVEIFGGSASRRITRRKSIFGIPRLARFTRGFVHAASNYRENCPGR